MAGSSDRVEEGVSVIADAAVLDPAAVPICVEDDVAGSQVVRDRVADASQVDGADAVENAVGRLVRVSREHELDTGALQVAPKLCLGAVRGDAITVVSDGDEAQP